MKIVKFAVIASIAALAGACAAPAAQADVTWEHTGTISVDPFPGTMAKFKTYSSFALRRERILVKYKLNDMMPLPFPSSGSAAIIERLDDDRLIGYASYNKSTINESLQRILGLSMWHPWGTAAPELEKRPTPRLTEAQRMRLGAELRTAFSPLINRFAPSVFRKLPNERTIQGITGHGYRLTQYISPDGNPDNAQRMQVSVEWWLGDIQQGDDVIYGLQDAAANRLEQMGYPSTSMWFNEMRMILLYALPEPYVKALKTVVPGDSLERPGFGGTPLALYVTVKIPKGGEWAGGMSMGDGGTVRVALDLTGRTVSHLPDSVFEAPEDYTMVDVSPYLRQAEEAHRKMTVEGFAQAIDAMVRAHTAPF